jgi:hypothetical protein
MGFYRGPHIVTDGLVLSLDAGNVKSYPGTGTLWNDLSGNGNNGTLINGPTFGSANGGSIVFDGVDDFCTLSQTTLTLITWTLHIDLFYQYNNKTFEFFFGNNIGDSSGKILLSYNGLVSFRNSIYYNFNVQSTELTNKNSVLSFVSNGVSISLYVNGVYRSVVTPNSTQLPMQSIGRAWSDLVWNSKFNLNNIKAYNRALTPDEILQNYNATKSRYNL